MKNSHYKKVLVVTASLLMSGQVLAQNFSFDSNQVTLTEQYCPAVTSLKQSQARKTWSAPGGWRSLNPSFFRELGQFLGAQWVGVNVGNIICSYGREGRSDFAVHIQRNTIVPAPIGGLWSDDKGGYKDCYSSNPQQCGFSVMTQNQPKNVYDEIDFYKEQTSPNNTK